MWQSEDLWFSLCVGVRTRQRRRKKASGSLHLFIVLVCCSGESESEKKSPDFRFAIVSVRVACVYTYTYDIIYVHSCSISSRRACGQHSPNLSPLSPGTDVSQTCGVGRPEGLAYVLKTKNLYTSKNAQARKIFNVHENCTGTIQ